jgi:hypothetical protein
MTHKRACTQLGGGYLIYSTSERIHNVDDVINIDMRLGLEHIHFAGVPV